MLELGADKIAFVILRARDYDHGPDGRGGRNAFELRDFIAGLTEDEQAELTAVMWIGRGTFDADDLEEAISTARAAPIMSSHPNGPPVQGAKPQPRIAPTSPSRMSVSTPCSSARTASSAWANIRRCWTSVRSG